MLLADILIEDPDFLKKLPHYKTAYSPTYQTYVGIVEVIYDSLGQPIIRARVAFTDKDTICLFRVEELADFVL